MLKFKQFTLSEQIEFKGIGLHSGVEVKLIVKPSEPDTGIVFKRVDIKNKDNIIKADFKNVVDPILCTKIKNESGVSVSTVEHLMAAFYGEGIDNALIEIDSSEVPIMDGSALDFVDSIRSVGLKNKDYLENL